MCSDIFTRISFYRFQINIMCPQNVVNVYLANGNKKIDILYKMIMKIMDVFFDQDLKGGILSVMI